MKSSIAIVLLSISLIFLYSCNNNQEYIEIEFERLNEVIDSVWIKIDDITYINSPHDFEWKSNNIFENTEGEKYAFIPSSTVYYYHPEKSEKRVTEKVSNFMIGMKLWHKLKTLTKDDKPIYQLVYPKLLTIQGKVSIMRTDGKRIIIEKSKDNLVRINQMVKRD